MSAPCYSPPVKDDELSTAEVAALWGASLDAVRAAIRTGTLPSRYEPRGRGGTYRVRRTDAEQARQARSSGRAVLSEYERTEVRAAQAAVDRARLAVTATEEARNATLHRIYHGRTHTERYGVVTELADLVGMHRTGVQRIVRPR